MSKFKTKAHSDLKKEMAQEPDRIKGLKLRRINAYLGGAALDEALRNIYSCYGLSRLGKKSPSSTAVHLLRHGSYICIAAAVDEFIVVSSTAAAALL